MDLMTSISSLPGVGPGTVWKLKKLGLETVEDLITHFPFRYDDFSNIKPAIEASIGEIVTLQGEIWSIKNVYTRSRKVLTQAVFNDGTSPINLTWFNQSWLTKQIIVGDKLQISGKLGKYKNKLSMMAPRWEKLETLGLHLKGVASNLHTGKLVAVYPETEGLTSKWFRTKIAQILPLVLVNLEDPLPKSIKKNMLSLADALNNIHLPDNWESAEKARERLGFDELFYISLATQKSRMEWKNKPVITPLKIKNTDIGEFLKSLPFTLTNAQQNTLKEVLVDLKSKQPMNRLIQGEVGSGKTIVATIIAYLAFKNKLKTLFMAPTEILAFQHFETLKKFLEPFNVKVGIYTGSKKFTSPVIASKAKQSNNMKKIAALPRNDDSVPDIIVGTHALLSDKLKIEKVGLIIIDEQQRFGVAQRGYLRAKAKPPHFLTMTATPIPRTVALTIYGDLDLSIIDELPKNRPKISTHLVPEGKRQDSYKFIEKKVLLSGDQVYIITPLIELSETLVSAKAATVEFENLKKVFPKLKLGLLHGRLKSCEKEKVLQSFRDGKIQILVSTSVVEVGMDIPNASIIVIEGAERFGLSQLHQLRGRVGRGTKESFCLLYTSDSSADKSRLKYLETTFDGMKLAEFDLKIRGGGEVFGTRQSGRFEFKIASLSDLALVEKTRNDAKLLLQDNPTLDKYPHLLGKLLELTSNSMPD